MSAMRTRKVFNRVASLMLAVVMMVGIFSAVSPQQAEAAAKTKSFKSTGTSSVTIKDSECYSKSGKRNVHWIKFKAGVTGYVTITMTDASKDYSYSAGYVTFCNSKKGAIGQKKEYWQTNSSYNLRKTKTYGIRKNKTYYFRVECAAGAKLKATVKSVKKSTANTKAKAKSLWKKKQVSGIMVAGESKADWYKIKLTKSQILKLTYSAKTNGENDYAGIKVSFYKSNGKLFMNNGPTNRSVDWVSPLNPSSWMRFYRTVNYSQKIGIPAGTYYVKVERYDKYSSGYYTLKWQ
jgi:hypothetical protein